ncbi:utrophin-like, partial [Scleropages formosus]
MWAGDTTTMASVTESADGAANSEFSDIIKWRSATSASCHTAVFLGSTAEPFSHNEPGNMAVVAQTPTILVQEEGKPLSCVRLGTENPESRIHIPFTDEHDAVQKKTFTKWINARFSKTGKPSIKDMFSDLRDGRKLLDLLEGLTGSVLTKERGSTRVHALNNVNRVLQVLHQNNVELVNIGGTDIVDGNHKLTLGLIWSIILHWQVKDVMKDIMSSLHQTNSEKILLSWVRQYTRSYEQVNVLNFTTSWADGLAFNAILHRYRPSIFSWDSVLSLTPTERLEHAFTIAKDQLGIERLLDPEDVAVSLPDKKSIIMYVTSLFAVLPKEVTMDDIREVETLPRKYKVDMEEVQGGGKQVSFAEDEATSPRADTPSTVTEMEGDVEVDLDGYQTALEEVLTWLLSAEDALQMQDDVSDDVEEVKDQFHTHEAFMMELTAHQSSVGNVLQAGNQLIAQGNLTAEEEEEIREQMTLLNSRWEGLRVASMDRQARLHEVLMDLQQQQLQQLSDWLTQTESRIQCMESEPTAGDMEGYQAQIEDHRNLFKSWLSEKEDALSRVQTSNFRDPNELNVNVRRLATLKEDMENKKRTLDQLSDAGQDVVQLLQSAEAAHHIQGDTDWLTQRWDNLVQRLEDCSYQVAESLTHTGLPQIQKTVAVDTAVTVGGEQSSPQQLPPPPPQKKRQLQEDQDIRALIEDDLPEILSWMGRWKRSLQALDLTDNEKMRDTSDIRQKLKMLEEQLVEKEPRVINVTQGGQALLGRLEKEGLPTEDLRSRLDAIKAEWEGSRRLLQELQERLGLRDRISNFCQELQMLEQAVRGSENWLRCTPEADADEACLQSLSTACEARLEELEALTSHIEQLASVAVALGRESLVAATLQDDWSALFALHTSTLEELRRRREELRSAPAKSSSQEEVELQLDSLQDGIVDVRTTEEAVLFQFVEQQLIADPVNQSWSQLSSRAQEELRMLRCLLESMQDAEVKMVRVQCWLDGVEAMISKEGATPGDHVKPQEELDQYTEYLNEMGAIEADLNQMLENVRSVQACALPGVATWGQLKLEECRSRWEKLSKQVLSSQRRALNLRKDLLEMQEWMVQVDEEFLMRDFEYKSPEELEGALEEMKRAKEDVLQKEVRVKILKDNINLLVTKSPSSGQDLTADLSGVLRNYQKLCERFRSKCHTLEVRMTLHTRLNSSSACVCTTGCDCGCEWYVAYEWEVWSCWMELLQYLDLENSWLNSLEERVQASEGLPENSQAINQALEALESVLRHPGDNRTQIRELGQTLIDGGILDEIISEKLEAFNSRYEQLSHQAVSRQIALEQQLQTVRENEQVLQTLQESLSRVDQTLTSYLTDRMDAFQLPQEAQCIQAEIVVLEGQVEDLRQKGVGGSPAVSQDGKASRGGTKLEQLQRKLREINTKFQLFQKPANFEQRMLDCKRVLEGAKAELHVLDVRQVEPEEIQAHLNGCMKLYKILSEVKLEVETVIKTGRQIVQKQQTENPRSMDEQLTALKLLYNDLGAQVTEGKQDLEKALSLSQKLQKDGTALQAWLGATEAVLQQKNTSGDMPADIDAEVAWAHGLLKELERREAELHAVTEFSAALQALVESSEAQLEERLCKLNSSWARVRTWAEDWLSSVLNHQNEVEIFDENLAHISTWLYQTEIHLDETEKLPANEKEEIVKNLLAELEDISLRVDSVRDQAVILMSSRGPACRDVVEPKLAELNRNFDKVSQHIKATKASATLAQAMPDPLQLQITGSLTGRELHQFQAELAASLDALDPQCSHIRLIAQDDDKMDEEKARVEEVLQKGDLVLPQMTGEGKDELRRKLLLLQTRYSALRELRALKTQQMEPMYQDASSHSWIELSQGSPSGLLGVSMEKAGLADDVVEKPMEKSLLLTPSDYLLDINKALLAMADVELLLNASELCSGLYEDFSAQEDALKVEQGDAASGNIKDGLEKLGDQVTTLHERQPDVVREASRTDVVQIGDALTQLNAEWDRLNRMFNDRKGCFDQAVEEWRRFHCDLSDLGQWLSEAERALGDARGPDSTLNLDKAQEQQEELEEGLLSHQPVLSLLTQMGESIVGQLSAPGSSLLEEKLQGLNQRWNAIQREVQERHHRLMGGDPNLAEFAGRLKELELWLEQAGCAVGSLPPSASDKNLKELKALAEEMDAKNQQLSWLNKNGPQMLSTRNLTSQEREQHVGRLRAINMEWSHVTRNLLDKVGEVEADLQGHAHFQDKLSRLSDWLHITQQTLSLRSPEENQVGISTHTNKKLSCSGSEVTPKWLCPCAFSLAQLLEVSMQERKRQLEELLSRSIQMQKRQQLLPQEKNKVEQLAADWKMLDLRVREMGQQPLSGRVEELIFALVGWWEQRGGSVSQQMSIFPCVFPAAVPSTVHVSSLRSAEPLHQATRSHQRVVPTDLNETATELGDWLVLIDQMLKSNIVTVGDLEEIRTTISRLEVTKGDLEQRHPQLEDIFTLAQNIKNKTSNLDVRTSITEKLEKVRSQWDSTQHGVEARLHQLDRLITDSIQWEERRRETKALIGQNESRLHNLMQQSWDPLTKQLNDNKGFLNDLSKGQAVVASFSELSGRLLRDYATDDTRRVKEVADMHSKSWSSLQSRTSDRQVVLEADLKELQASLKELEGFLKWLQEAETTVNVLADASQRQDLSQDSSSIKELRGQLEKSGRLGVMAVVRSSLQKVVVFLHRLQRMAISSPRYQKLYKVSVLAALEFHHRSRECCVNGGGSLEEEAER